MTNAMFTRLSMMLATFDLSHIVVTHAVPINIVHLLKSLLSHSFDFLLIVETIGDLQRYLLLLHRGELVVVRLLT